MSQLVVLSHRPWSQVPTRTMQLTTRLTGAQILFFAPGKGEPRQVRPNVTHCPVAAPPHLPESAGLLQKRLWKRLATQIQKQLTRSGFRRPTLWCTSPRQVHLLDALDYRGLVYDCHRDWSHLPGRWEGDLASAADVIFAASPWLVERISPCNFNVTLLPNGVNYPMFSQSSSLPPPDLARLQGPILGFVGLISEDLDLAPVEYCALAHPHWQLVLVGKVTGNPRLARLSALENVHLLGHKPMVDIPDYINAFDVCLDLRRARQQVDEVVPRRIFEYLAAGKPTVTLLFPDQVEEFPDVIYGAHTLSQFDRMCASALTEDKDWVTPRRRDYGAASAWSNRAKEVSRILGAIGLY